MSKGLRIFGHPLHAALSDFPMVFLMSSLLWDLIGHWRPETVWSAMAFWSVVLGLTAAMFTAFAGAVDYAALPSQHPATRTAVRHMLAMLSALVPFVIVLVIRRGPGLPSPRNQIISLALEASGGALLSLGGWLGGHLVFHHRVGTDEESGSDDN
ncbi:MAG TPA: DUF2231 domain-containing protein [Pyrinomonadaceae bacterium]|nr:DUF2231 domain-containing protein [Pyrinomonadaceae bacterium]